jgi:trans-aconitate 3-methyltransferase
MLISGYGDVSIVGHPELSPLMRNYWYGGPRTLGPYWEQPGRSIVVSLYRDIVPPETLYKDVTRYFFPRESETGEREETIQISEKMTFETLRTYMGTYSSYHGWKNDFPHRKSRESGGSGDILDELFDALKDATGWEDDREFNVEWGSGIILARKKD